MKREVEATLARMKDGQKLDCLRTPTRWMTLDQALRWPLDGCVERTPSMSSRWHLTAHGHAVRAEIEREFVK